MRATIDRTSPIILLVGVLILGSIVLAASCAPASITIVENPNAGKLQVSTYYRSETTDLIPVELGQAIADDGMFALANADIVLTVSRLTDGGSYDIHFGSVGSGGTNDYSRGSYSKTATDGIITILKSELAANNFSFTDGAVIGISGSGITDTEHVASYHPSNIRNHQDLQAMKNDLGQDYILKNDIEFPPLVGTNTSNYETVGDDSTPFTGSLDGAGYSITGVQIENSEDYQGLFGVMAAGTVDTVIAQRLVLRGFEITANAAVGSLAGQVKRGTINNVIVEVVEVGGLNRGKVEVKGGIALGSTTAYSYGGGLVGLSGGLANSRVSVRIQNTSSAVAVSGTGAVSSRIGGLVGDLSNTIVTGYVTGDVTGNNTIGGLCGVSSGVSVVTGYTTGTMTGDSNVGGISGFNSGTIRGYTTGSAIGKEKTGGLTGTNFGSVSGYSRSVIRRSEGTELSFGKTAGSVIIGGTAMSYHSASEQVYDGLTGTTALAGTTGTEGTAVTVDVSTMQSVFMGFVFGTDLGDWTWVADGKWPAINMGDIKLASEQPVEP